MPVVVPGADPAGLPAPAWLLQSLSVFTLILHLLAMNLLVGGTALLALNLRRRSDNEFHYLLSKRLSKALPTTMAMTITLGIAPLLFVQALYGQAFYTSSALMAWPWLAIILLLLVAYYGLYLAQFRPDWLGAGAEPVAWVSALALLVIGFLFTNNASLMLLPPKWSSMYAQSAAGLHLNWSDSTLLPRYLHFLAPSFAVTGLGVMLLGVAYRRAEPDWAEQAQKYGAKWFVGATLVQMAVGLWFLFSLPDSVRQMFLGGSLPDTAILWIGVFVAVGAVGAASRSAWQAAALILVTISLMVVARHRVREWMLRPHLDVSALPVNPQWGMFVIFAALLVIGLVVVGWMVWQFVRAGPFAAPGGDDLLTE